MCLLCSTKKASINRGAKIFGNNKSYPYSFIVFFCTAPESTPGDHETLKTNLEDLLKLMLMVWCRENVAIKLMSPKPIGKS